MCFAKEKFGFIFVFSVEKVSSGKDSKLQVAFSREHDYKNQFIKIRNMSVIHVLCNYNRINILYLKTYMHRVFANINHMSIMQALFLLKNHSLD